jgi:2-methylfumaryl-CoA isomerase
MVVLTGRRDGSSDVDYTVNPSVGFPTVTGPRDSPRPVNHLLPAWDAIAGNMSATGLLAAERFRRRTGQGQLVKLALRDVALAMLGHLGKIAEVSINDADRAKDGNYLYGAFGRDFETLDAKQLMVVALTSAQWKSLKDATGLAGEIDALGKRLGFDLDKEGDRYRARRELTRIFDPWFRGRMLSEIRQIFDANRVTWAPYRRIREVVEKDRECSPESPMFELVDQPGIGRYLMPGTPFDFGAVERESPVRAPLLGEHTDEILLDLLKLPESAVARLHDEGVVAGPKP